MNDQHERRSVDERREQLIDAAIDVLATDGLAGTTTRRITEHAGVALGAFHYAFRSKDDLLRAVIERFSAGITAVLDQAAAEPFDTVEVLTERVIRGYWAFVEETPQLQLAQYELTLYALRNPDLRELGELQYTRMSDAVMSVLGRVPGLVEGQEREDLARYLAATMDGLILQHVVQRDDVAARRRLELYLRSMPGLIDAVVTPVTPDSGGFVTREGGS